MKLGVGELLHGWVEDAEEAERHDHGEQSGSVRPQQNSRYQRSHGEGNPAGEHSPWISSTFTVTSVYAGMLVWVKR